MPVEMKKCESSNLDEYGYDPDAKELHVRFKRSKPAGAAEPRTYIHSGVSPEDYKAFCDASSKGAHYAKHIRSKFEFR